jgi:uncharacterized protein
MGSYSTTKISLPVTALVTGASSGIGESFCHLLARQNCEIVVVARREERLQALKNTLESAHQCKVHVLPMDLSDPESAVKIFAATEAIGLEIDTLVNNAGYGISDRFVETSWDDQQKFIQVMATTPSRLCHLYLPLMISRGGGRILNVGSISSFFPGSPSLTLYAALKHYILTMSQSLSVETEGSGVTVTALCPGPTETAWIDDTGNREFVDGLPAFMLLSADEVAKQGYQGMLQGKRCVVPGIGAKITLLLTKLLPSSLMLKLLRNNFA